MRKISALLLALVAANPVCAQMLSEEQADALSSAPKPQACSVLDFDQAEIVGGFVTDTWFVVVSGTKPWVTMRVDLVPHVYVEQPEYWVIEVVGCLQGVGLPATAPFSASLQVNDLGTLGVEVRGAGNAIQLEVPPK